MVFTLINFIINTAYFSLAISLMGLIFSRHNLMVMILFADLILLNFALIACFQTYFIYSYLPYIFVLTLIAVAACETAIALALAVSMYEKHSTLDMLFVEISKKQLMRGL